MDNAGGEAGPVVPPPSVPELADQLGVADDVPARYLVRAGAGNNDLTKATETAPIPVIDLARLCQPGGGDDEASKLRLALQSWGLFLVTNHGMEAPLMDAMMDASREFFGQPLLEKQKHRKMVARGQKHFQGYGTEKQILGWCEHLYLGVEPEEDRKLDLWPTCIRDVLLDFTTKCKKVKDCLLPEKAKLLELDDNYFIDRFDDKADTNVRIGYYPPSTRPDLVFGLKPHADGTVVTLLMVDNSVRGLQVLRESLV